MRIWTQGGSEGSSGTPNGLSFVSRQDPHTTASLWMLHILLGLLGWDCLWWEPHLAVGERKAGAAPGVVLQYKY